MIPYRDSLSQGKRGEASVALAVSLALAHALVAFGGSLGDSVSIYLSFIPYSFSSHPFWESYSLISASFLHADLLHLAGNCLFLIVFGTTLERLFGKKAFLLLFPLLGIPGFLLQWATASDSQVPIVGASGAIAFLMGGYLPLFPEARLRMIFFWGFAWKRFTLPSWAFLLYWFSIQAYNTAYSSDSSVAFGVHVGSFLAGTVCAVIWKTSYPSAEEHLNATVRALQAGQLRT